MERHRKGAGSSWGRQRMRSGSGQESSFRFRRTWLGREQYFMHMLLQTEQKTPDGKRVLEWERVKCRPMLETCSNEIKALAEHSRAQQSGQAGRKRCVCCEKSCL